MTSRPPDAAEFDTLYQRHSREVWALAYARYMDADAASDIAQEAFLRLWREWRAGQVIHNPRAWVLRVARNLAEDYAKSAFRRNGTHPPQTMNMLESQDAAPLDRLVEVERFTAVRAILKELPAADRELLTLKYALDYNTNAIADLLEINPSAVHMRLSRARQRLAERLTAQGILERNGRHTSPHPLPASSETAK